jgi:hypothetical protein
MPKFGKEDNGLYYNEYYGYVTLRVAEAINEFKWSPSDFNMAIYQYGSMEELNDALKTNSYVPNDWPEERDLWSQFK